MIDDIEHLITNAEKDSQIIYVDSSQRNKLFYPNANEYTIEFEQPFKLVYGFDILDATVPVTMYNIDIYNNSIYFSVIQHITQDVDTDKYFTEISKNAVFAEIYNRDVETHVVIGVRENLAALLSHIPQPDPNYAVFVRNSITTNEIFLRTNQTDQGILFFKFFDKNYGIRNNESNRVLIDLIVNTQYYMYYSATGTEIIYYDIYTIDKQTYTVIEKSTTAYELIIHNYVKYIEIGNYDILSLTNDLNSITKPLGLEIEPSTPDPKKQAKVNLKSDYMILLNGNRGELIKSLGFDTYPTLTQSVSNYKGWIIGDNYFIFGSISYDALSDTGTVKKLNKIVSPGLVSLLGERYAILRIKELEDHLHGSYSYMRMTPGIGMFKMAAPFGGLTNLRFDFTSVVKKPFHPIGKLTRLSIRFETASTGKLYDFKGVNHQLMFNIKFYVPTQKINFGKSILNPNYDPDFLKYMAGNKAIQFREDSDEEEEFDIDNHKNYTNYKLELQKYDYSSSDDESNKNSEQSDEALSDYLTNFRRTF
jgi:hypothetical protein